MGLVHEMKFNLQSNGVNLRAMTLQSGWHGAGAAIDIMPRAAAMQCQGHSCSRITGMRKVYTAQFRVSLMTAGRPQAAILFPPSYSKPSIWIRSLHGAGRVSIEEHPSV